MWLLSANFKAMNRLALCLCVLTLSLAVASEAAPRWPFGEAAQEQASSQSNEGGRALQSPTPRPPAAELRADLTQVLQRPEYNQLRQSEFINKLREAWERFQRWWREHFSDQFVALHDMAPALYWTITGFGLLIVVLLLYHIYLTMRSAFGRGPRAQVRRRREGGAEVHADPETLLAEADRAAAEGNLPEALRRLYLALIRRLDRLGALRYDRAFTNQDYLRQVRGAGPVHGPLSALTAAAERVWYGRQGLDSAQYARCRELAMAAWEQGEGHGKA
ncbi:MAG: DUF4129 domain-containing protein [Armatimonadia bacterium]